MKRTLFILLAGGLASSVWAQPTPHWESPSKPGYWVSSGWKYLRHNPPETRFFVSDSVSYRLMTGAYSTSVAVTIPFSRSEHNNYDTYASAGIADVPDVTGDGIDDLVIEGQSAPCCDYRRSFRIVNIMTGQNVLVFDNPNYNYSTSADQVGDLDGDGLNELVIARSPYPNTTPSPVVYQVYKTAGKWAAVSTESSTMPEQLTLMQNYPNPFNPSTTIAFDLPVAGPATLEIFDLNGRVVRDFSQQHQEAGTSQFEWDGKDRSGARVASGSYFYRLLANGVSPVKKMIVVR
jgi:hypothetical protein